MDMTAECLKDICRKDALYSTPHLNDRLFLHCKGFRKIQNLEPYTGLTSLWLESNAIEQIEGLDTLVNLKTLFLHENIIGTIENLDHQAELDSLNLSRNFVRKIENLESCQKLTSLKSICAGRIASILPICGVDM